MKKKRFRRKLITSFGRYTVEKTFRSHLTNLDLPRANNVYLSLETFYTAAAERKDKMENEHMETSKREKYFQSMTIKVTYSKRSTRVENTRMTFKIKTTE